MSESAPDNCHTQQHQQVRQEEWARAGRAKQSKQTRATCNHHHNTKQRHKARGGTRGRILWISPLPAPTSHIHSLGHYQSLSRCLFDLPQIVHASIHHQTTGTEYLVSIPTHPAKGHVMYVIFPISSKLFYFLKLISSQQTMQVLACRVARLQRTVGYCVWMLSYTALIIIIIIILYKLMSPNCRH